MGMCEGLDLRQVPVPQRRGLCRTGRLRKEEFLLLGMSWASSSYPAPLRVLQEMDGVDITDGP